MGSVHRIAGFTYLPRQDKSHDGIVDTYRFETSVDGQNWTATIDSGRFWNIENNPTLQEASFTPVNARFFRFTAVKEIGANGLASAAEISVLAAEGESGQ
jgi:alpha-L-fucosidase